MNQGYEFFDHTADVGVRLRGGTLQALFSHAMAALTQLIAENSSLESSEERVVELKASDASTLLLSWLQELLFWFSTDRFLPASCIFGTLTPMGLRAHVRGERFDPARHVFGTEVKGITRHALDVQQTPEGWEGTVIFDV